MKKFILIALAVLVTFTACKEHEDKINEVKIQAIVEGLPQASVEILLVDKTHGTSYTAVTGADGYAVFNLVAGLYEASSTFYKEAAIYNGINSAISVTDAGRTTLHWTWSPPRPARSSSRNCTSEAAWTTPTSNI